jgi:hypothetical protein
MELSDLMIEVERYVSRRGLTHSDSIESLLNSMYEDTKEEE